MNYKRLCILVILFLIVFSNNIVFSVVSTPEEVNVDINENKVTITGRINAKNEDITLIVYRAVSYTHLATGKAGIANTKYNNYIIPMFDYADGWDDGGPMYVPVAAMLHGTMAVSYTHLNSTRRTNYAYSKR